MSKNKTIDTTVLTTAVIGSLILVNLVSLGLGLFGRLDLTRDSEFTLSRATKDTLAAITDPVTVKAYFTKELPPPYSTTSRYVKDLLDEYFNHSKGKFSYEFIDPTSQETDEDKQAKKDVKQDIFGRAIREQTSVEKELQQEGIPPIQVRVNEGDKLEVKQVYMGLVVRQGDKKEVIPVVQETDGLEYNLTTALRKVIRKGGSEGLATPKIAILTGHDAPDPREKLGKFVGMLGQLYDVSFLDLAGKTEVPADLTALLVIGPRTALSDDEQKAIDQFIMSGKSVGFFLSPVAIELRKLESTPAFSGLDAMVRAYGIEIQPGLMLDPQCATLTVGRQQGFMQIQQPVQYLYMPMPKALDPKNALTRGMTGAAFPFMSPLAAVATATGVQVQPVVSTSSQSWAVLPRPPSPDGQPTPLYNLDPFYRWTNAEVVNPGSRPIIMTATGPLKSYFAQLAEAQSASSPVAKTVAENARVLVSGGYAFTTDDFSTPGNQALLANLVDWLAGDDALLAIRARGLAAAPIDDTIADSSRNLLKYSNIFGVPLLFALIGVVRWRMREARRSTASFDT